MMAFRHTLLALLTAQPKHGHRLHQEFEDITGQCWPLNSGQIYAALWRLHRSGLVEPTEVTGRARPFRITQLGRESLAEWLNDPTTGRPPQQDYVVRVLLAFRAPGINVSDVIEGQRAHLTRALDRWIRLKRRGPTLEHDVGADLAIEYTILHLQACIEWLDAAKRVLVEPSPVIGAT